MYLSSDLMALAIIPGLLLIIYVYRKDKVEKEPIGLIIKIIIFGVISCIAAGYLEQAESQLLPAYQPGTLEYALQTSFCMAALVEEIVKFLAMRLGSWRYPGFNYRFDGVVYGVSAAVGFAIYENIMYVAMYGMQTAVVRAFTAIPLHAFCGAFMGAFYGKAKKAQFEGRSGDARSLQIKGLLIAIAVHGFYDTFAMWDNDIGFYLLLGFVVIMYIIGLRMIRTLAREDEWITGGAEANVPEFVQSYPTPEMERIKGTNGLSIASLVCGIVSFLSMAMFVIPSLLAIGLGIAGNKRSGEGVKDNCAKAGIIMGVISLVINAILIFIFSTQPPQ